MIGQVVHIGITVSDIERAIAFYRDVLGLELQGRMEMRGESTQLLFGKVNCEAKVAYLNGGDALMAPPIELIEFNTPVEQSKGSLFRTGVSEICFAVDDIVSEYETLKAKGVVFLSEPQEFDSTRYGMGRSIAVYFYDSEGNILELLQPLD